MTLFFASDSSLFDLPLDSIISRTNMTAYKPQYITADYLIDRFQTMKIDRLNESLKSSIQINSLNKPLLVYKQAIYRSKTNAFDSRLVPLLLETKVWLIALPALVPAYLRVNDYKEAA